MAIDRQEILESLRPTNTAQPNPSRTSKTTTEILRDTFGVGENNLTDSQQVANRFDPSLIRPPISSFDVPSWTAADARQEWQDQQSEGGFWQSRLGGFIGRALVTLGRPLSTIASTGALIDRGVTNLWNLVKDPFSKDSWSTYWKSEVESIKEWVDINKYNASMSPQGFMYHVVLGRGLDPRKTVEEEDPESFYQVYTFGRFFEDANWLQNPDSYWGTKHWFDWDNALGTGWSIGPSTSGAIAVPFDLVLDPVNWVGGFGVNKSLAMGLRYGIDASGQTFAGSITRRTLNEVTENVMRGAARRGGTTLDEASARQSANEVTNEVMLRLADEVLDTSTEAGAKAASVRVKEIYEEVFAEFAKDGKLTSLWNISDEAIARNAVLANMGVRRGAGPWNIFDDALDANGNRILFSFDEAGQVVRANKNVDDVFQDIVNIMEAGRLVEKGINAVPASLLQTVGRYAHRFGLDKNAMTAAEHFDEFALKYAQGKVKAMGEEAYRLLPAAEREALEATWRQEAAQMVNTVRTPRTGVITRFMPDNINTEKVHRPIIAPMDLVDDVPFATKWGVKIPMTGEWGRSTLNKIRYRVGKAPLRHQTGFKFATGVPQSQADELIRAIPKTFHKYFADIPGSAWRRSTRFVGGKKKTFRMGVKDAKNPFKQQADKVSLHKYLQSMEMEKYLKTFIGQRLASAVADAHESMTRVINPATGRIFTRRESEVLLFRAMEGDEASEAVLKQLDLMSVKDGLRAAYNEVLMSAKSQAGIDFLNFIDDFGHRAITPEFARELRNARRFNFRQGKGSPDMQRSGTEHARKYVKPSEYKKRAKEWWDTLTERQQKRFDLPENFDWTDEAGLPFLVRESFENAMEEARTPIKMGFGGKDFVEGQSIVAQINNTLDEAGIGWHMFEENLTKSSKAYAEMLAHRTSQVWLESELQNAGILMHRWLYKNGVPTTAERMASRRIHKNIEEMEKLRADLEVRLSQAFHATDEETQSALRAQILDLEDQIRQADEVYEASVKYAEEVNEMAIASEQKLVAKEAEITQIEADIAARQYQLDNMERGVLGQAAKQSVKRAKQLQEELAVLETRLNRAVLGTPENNFRDSLFYTRYMELEDAVRNTKLIEEQLAMAFGSVRGAREAAMEYRVAFNELFGTDALDVKIDSLNSTMDFWRHIALRVGRDVEMPQSPWVDDVLESLTARGLDDIDVTLMKDTLDNFDVILTNLREDGLLEYVMLANYSDLLVGSENIARAASPDQVLKVLDLLTDQETAIAKTLDDLFVNMMDMTPEFKRKFANEFGVITEGNESWQQAFYSTIRNQIPLDPPIRNVLQDTADMDRFLVTYAEEANARLAAKQAELAANPAASTTIEHRVIASGINEEVKVMTIGDVVQMTKFRHGVGEAIQADGRMSIGPSIDELSATGEVVETLGYGRGQQMVAPDGKKYFVKQYSTDQRANADVVASRIYSLFDSSAPLSWTSTDSTGNVFVIKEWVEGTSVSQANITDTIVMGMDGKPRLIHPDLLAEGVPSDLLPLNALAVEFQKGVLGDLLTGNWGAAGEDFSHLVLREGDGAVIRVNQGETFDFLGLNDEIIDAGVSPFEYGLPRKELGSPTVRVGTNLDDGVYSARNPQELNYLVFGDDIAEEATQITAGLNSQARLMGAAEPMLRSQDTSVESMVRSHVAKINDVRASYGGWKTFIEDVLPDATPEQQAYFTNWLELRSKALVESFGGAYLEEDELILRAAYNLGMAPNAIEKAFKDGSLLNVIRGLKGHQGLVDDALFDPTLYNGRARVLPVIERPYDPADPASSTFEALSPMQQAKRFGGPWSTGDHSAPVWGTPAWGEYNGAPRSVSNLMPWIDETSSDFILHPKAFSELDPMRAVTADVEIALPNGLASLKLYGMDQDAYTLLQRSLDPSLSFEQQAQILDEIATEFFSSPYGTIDSWTGMDHVRGVQALMSFDMLSKASPELRSEIIAYMTPLKLNAKNILEAYDDAALNSGEWFAFPMRSHIGDTEIVNSNIWQGKGRISKEMGSQYAKEQLVKYANSSIRDAVETMALVESIFQTPHLRQFFEYGAYGENTYQGILEWVMYRRQYASLSSVRTTVDDLKSKEAFLSDDVAANMFKDEVKEFNYFRTLGRDSEEMMFAQRDARDIVNDFMAGLHIQYRSTRTSKATTWGLADDADGFLKRTSRSLADDPTARESHLLARLWESYHTGLAREGYVGTGWANNLARNPDGFARPFHFNVNLTNPLAGRIKGVSTGESFVQNVLPAWERQAMEDTMQFMMSMNLGRQTNQMAVNNQYLLSASNIDASTKQITDAIEVMRRVTRDQDSAYDRLVRSVDEASELRERSAEDWFVKQRADEWVIENAAETVRLRSSKPDKQLINEAINDMSMRNRELASAREALRKISPEFEGSGEELFQAYKDVESALGILAKEDADVARKILATATPEDLKSIKNFKVAFKDVKARKEVGDAIDRVMIQGFRAIGLQSQGPRSIVDTLTEMDSSYGGGNKFLEYYDKVQNVWKGYAILSPGFYSRNFQGGVFMNYLAGVNPTSYIKYVNARTVVRLQNELVRKGLGPKKQKWLNHLVRTSDPYEVEVARIIDSTGAAGHGQAGTEFAVADAGKAIVRVGGRDINLQRANPFSSQFILLEKAQKFNVGQIEDILRGTLMFDEIVNKGGTASTGMEQVWKFHFNYQDLSAFERGVVKRIFPFYTWTRYAIPRVLEQYGRNPARMHRYTYAMNRMEDSLEGDMQDLETVPDWIIKGGGIPVNMFDEDGQHSWLTLDLPPRALFDTINPMTQPNMSVTERIGAAMQPFANMMTPLIKTPLEIATQRNVFQGYSYKGDFKQVPFPFDNDALMLPISLLTGNSITTKTKNGNWVMKDSYLNGLKNLIPPLNSLSRVMPDTKKGQDKRLASLMSWLFGIGLRHNSLEEQARQRRYGVYERRRELQEVRDMYKIDAEVNAMGGN